MSLDKLLFYTIEPESLKIIWEKFSKKINGKFDFKESIRANVNGPIYTYEIVSQLYDCELKISQTIYIVPGRYDKPTAHEYNLLKNSNKEILFRIWEKNFFEKIFRLNNANTGIPEIDNKFSLNTNQKKLEELFKKNKKFRETLTSKDYFFFIETSKRIVKMTLKRRGIANSIEDFDNDIDILKLVLNEIN